MVEQGVMIAGRPTTRYSGYMPFLASYIDLWVDDEYGIILKSAAARPQYLYIQTYETTLLTFGGVTEENIIDISRDALPLLDASGKWQYVLLNGGAVITEYADWDVSCVLAIPVEIDGHRVTGIGEDALAWRSALTGVTLPGSLTAIGARAFAGCSVLTELTLPQSLIRIGENAFESCSGLTSMTIPKSVATIGDSAFEGCDQLTLSVMEGSFAEQYAKENGIIYVFK